MTTNKAFACLWTSPIVLKSYLEGYTISYNVHNGSDVMFTTNPANIVGTTVVFGSAKDDFVVLDAKWGGNRLLHAKAALNVGPLLDYLNKKPIASPKLTSMNKWIEMAVNETAVGMFAVIMYSMPTNRKSGMRTLMRLIWNGSRENEWKSLYSYMWNLEIGSKLVTKSAKFFLMDSSRKNIEIMRQSLPEPADLPEDWQMLYSMYCQLKLEGGKNLCQFL